MDVRKSVSLPNILWKRVNNIGRQIRQPCGNDPAKLPARDAGNFLVDRNVSADIERCRLVAIIEELEFGVEKNELGFVTIEIHPAEEHNFTARAELPSLEKASMEPFGVSKAAAIGEDDIQNPAAGAGLDHAASIDFRVNGSILADAKRRSRDEVRPILVGLGD